jgi:hypothetical protein
MVELPLTMAQDHTLFEILRHRDETAWLHKTEYLRSRGGMVLLDTHPDYLADDRVFAAYQRYLERFVNDCAWRALPCEVSSWWRRRAESVLKRSDSGWVVLGPAAPDASIELTPPPSL